MTFTNFYSANATAESFRTGMELVCPVDSMVTLRTAVDNGADWIHLDYCEHVDIPSLSGLNLAAINRGIRYAHDKQRKVLLEINAYPQLSSWEKLRSAIDLAAQYGVDAVVLSDPALLLYAAAQYPHLRLHYSMHDTALNRKTINFFHKHFGVSRILLPRALTLAQIAWIAENTSVELQLVGFGKRCLIAEQNNSRSTQLMRSNGDSRHDGAKADLCAIIEDAANDGCFACDQQSDIGTLKLLPQLTALGISAVKVEALGHGPRQLAQVIRVWREAVDECLENLDHYSVKPSWITGLGKAAKDQKTC